MDKQQAEQALSIIRGVIENTREDLIAHNWGAIWITHSVTNGLAFASIGWFVERPGYSVFWYLAPLVVVAVVNLVIVTLLAHRDQGVRSFIETQLHGIWTTYVVFSVAVAGVLHISGADPKLFCPILAITTGIAFCMMGVIFYRGFFVAGAMFLLVAMIAPLATQIQWYIMGAAWAIAMLVPGIVMTREKARRGGDERQSDIL